MLVGSVYFSGFDGLMGFSLLGDTKFSQQVWAALSEIGCLLPQAHILFCLLSLKPLLVDSDLLFPVHHLDFFLSPIVYSILHCYYPANYLYNSIPRPHPMSRERSW